MSKQNKYRATKTMVDGILFDSKAEARYYQLNHKVPNLKRQVKFELLPKFQCEGKNYRGIHYVADFVFYSKEGVIQKVVDVKGMVTPEFKLKAKLFMSQYGMPIMLAVYDYRTGLFKEITL